LRSTIIFSPAFPLYPLLPLAGKDSARKVLLLVPLSPPSLLFLPRLFGKIKKALFFAPPFFVEGRVVYFYSTLPPLPSPGDSRALSLPPPVKQE